MKAAEMWKRFSEKEKITSKYEAWAYGDSPDELAELTLTGRKTATASAYDCYLAEKEPLPEAGSYSVVLDSREEAVCVIRTTKVSVVPFLEVSEQHAYKEGEGDRSLAYWRKVHERFFKEEFRRIGMDFEEHRKVVCEEFEVVYRG